MSDSGEANKANNQREDLPVKRYGRDEACGEIKDGTKERAKRREGWNEFTGTEKLRNPGERPIVPIKTCEREQKPIADDGDEREDNGCGYLWAAYVHHRL